MNRLSSPPVFIIGWESPTGAATVSVKSSPRTTTMVLSDYQEMTTRVPCRPGLLFHMMGLYPNAGQDYYLINTPLLEETIFRLDNGRTFRISTQGLSDKNRYIQSVTLNGAAYPYSAIRHKDIIAGGELILKMGKKPSEWGQQLLLNEENKK